MARKVKESTKVALAMAQRRYRERTNRINVMLDPEKPEEVKLAQFIIDPLDPVSVNLSEHFGKQRERFKTVEPVGRKLKKLLFLIMGDQEIKNLVAKRMKEGREYGDQART